MDYTTNYNLNLPSGDDSADVEKLNENAEIIDRELFKKVDGEEGKGLSTNDYTTAEKDKLAGIEAGAEVNKPVDQTYNPTSTNAQSGTAVAEALNPIFNNKQDNIAEVRTNTIIFDDKKAVFPQVPTTDSSPENLGDLTTKSYVDTLTADFITRTVNNLANYYLKSETYTRTEVQNLISAIQAAHFEKVQELPQTGESNVIYLVPRTSPKTGNIYDEYIWLTNTYEKIGSTEVDLTGYATESWVNTQISGFLTQSQIESLINTALTNYYTKTETDALLDNKADVNGIYDEMIVGNAQNLVSTKKINDNTPYNFRTSGGSLDIKSGVGNLEEDSLVGGTVAWNQLIDPITSVSVNGVDVTSSNGFYTISGTANASSGRTTNIVQRDISIINGHKYLKYWTIDVNPTDSNDLKFYITVGETVIGIASSNIISASVTGSGTFGFNTVSGQSYDKEGYIQIFDLTQMFGESIADYIYNLEQTTTGAGLAYFKSLFPKDYYEYDAGTFISVKTPAHKMTGFNAYNPATGEAKLAGNRKYQITGTYTSLSFEGQSIALDSDNYYTPSTTGTLTIEGGNNTDTCVHLVWDGERDNEYEKYKEYNYPLDSDLELRGIPKLDVNNKLYYDGDEYKSDGTVIKKYGKVDLGTLTWLYSPGNNNPRFQSTIIENLKVSSTDYSSFILCSKYTPSNVPIVANNVDKTIAVYNQKVYIHDESISSSATSSEIQAALSGVYLIYELQTPTTESAAPFTNPQYVNDWGTEEYVDNRDIAIPAGHNTKYSVNLKAKLEMAPDSPNQGNGDYLVRQTDGINEYVKYIAPEIPIKSISQNGTPITPDSSGNVNITGGGGTVDQTYDPTSTNAQSGTAVAEAVDDKLTEPSSGLAVGKYFRVASIDNDGHAVLEYVDAPTPIEKDYELIQKVIIGYSITTTQPADWTTNYTDYFVNTGTIKEPIYTAVQGETAPDWEEGMYYSFSNSITDLTIRKEPNGENYNFKKIRLEIAQESSPSTSLAFSINDAGMGYPTALANTKCYFVVEAEIQNGRLYLRCSKAVDNRILGGADWSNVFFLRALGYLDFENITSFRFNKQGNIIPSNSEIVIYGVRV